MDYRQVKITEVTSPWDFLAVEDSDDEVPGSTQFAYVMENMNNHLNSLMEQGSVTQRPKEGEICAVLRREDNRWHRARIDSWLERNKGKYACCYLIDKGYQETIPVQRLMKLSTTYTDHPPKVLHCSLWGIQPLSLRVEQSDTGLSVANRPSKNWDASASDFMRRMFDNTSRRCKIEVIERDADDKLHVRLLSNTKRGAVCFNDTLVEENYATRTEETDFSSVHTWKETARLNGTAATAERVSTEEPSDPCPPLISEDEIETHPLSEVCPPLISEDDTETYPINKDQPIDTCPPLVSDDDLDSYQLKDHESPDLCPPLISEDDVETFQAKNNNSPQMDGLAPSVSDFFKKCLSSPEKFPPLSAPSSPVKADIAADTFRQHHRESGSIERNLYSPTQSFSLSKQSEGNSPSQLKSPSPSFPHSQAAAEVQVQSLPLKPLLATSTDTLFVHNISHGRGRALLASCLLKRPGLSNTETSIFPSTTPGDNVPSMEPSVTERISNLGQFTNHTETADSEAEAAPVLNVRHRPQHATPTPNTRLHPQQSNASVVSDMDSVSDQVEQACYPSETSTKLSGEESNVSPSAGTRVRFRKSGDQFLKKKSPSSQKGVKSESSKVPVLSYLKSTTADFRDNAVRFARGQAQGRQFLEELRMSSGQTDRYPTITRSDQPLPQPFLGVIAHGKSPPALKCYIEELPFDKRIKQILKHKLGVETARSVQGYVWPAAFACRHVIGVCPPDKGKTMAYIPAVLSLLCDKTMYIELPKGKGPLAVVVVPTWKKARDVFEMIKLFTKYEGEELNIIRPLVVYAGGAEEQESTHMSLIRGCEILVATPASLLRILDQELTSLKRVCHMILDDADILGARFADQVDEIMQQFRLVFKNRRHQVVPCQIMMFASRWTKKLEEFRLCYTWEPVVVISSRVEASVYGGVKQVVTLSRWEQRLSTFCSLLDTMVPTDKRVAAFTSDVAEAVDMWKGAKSRGVYCLLIHQELPEESVKEAREQWLHSSLTKQLIVMVCTDQCYQDLAITNATDVIHYGLPDSKTKFGNRLVCMLDFFIDRTASEEYQPEGEAVSHVILTDRCAPRAEQLNEILQRCPFQHPPQLKEFLRGYRVGVENNEKKMLCPLLKAFGTCIAHTHHENCENRHLVIPKQDLKTGEIDGNNLPTAGQVTIKILRVVTAGRFYCHLVGHRPVGSSASQDLRLTYFKLAMDMTSYYSKLSNHVPYMPSEDPFHDGLCALKDVEGVFTRAKVVEWREGHRSAPVKECRLWLVDLGRYEKVTVDQLLKLPRRLAEIPYQAVEVYLCCVKPVDDDKEWTDKANIYVHNLTEGKELVGRIMLSAGLTFWLMPLVHQVTLKAVGVTSDISLRYELLQNNYAVRNPDHMKMLYELYRGKTEIPETLMSQYFEYCLEIELSQEMLPQDEAEFHKVQIAAVINPSIFYLHREGAIERLEELETKIQEAVMEFDEAADRGEKVDAGMTLEHGSVCLALSSDDRWYRAKLVSHCVEDKWDVFFLDYGDRERLPQSKLRGLPRCLGELPCQAIECKLAHIAPIGQEWSNDTVDIFCDLSYFANQEKKLLYAKVVADQDSDYTMGKKLVVDLYETQREEVCFSHELVKRHKAQVVQEEDGDQSHLKPVLGKPALKKQMFFNCLDKVKFLAANLYWTEDEAEALLQAEELAKLLSFMMRGWDVNLHKRDVLPSVVKVVGYVPCVSAHGVMLHSLAKCCFDSHILCDAALDHGLMERLACCLEQKSEAEFQHQAAEAVAQLVSSESFRLDCVETMTLPLTLDQVFSSHSLESPVSPKVLRHLCSTAAQLIYTASESVGPVCSLETVLQALQEAPDDQHREPWLEMLTAMASKHCTHDRLMRQANMKIILGFLDSCVCTKCLYYSLMICLSLADANRKHKKILLENNLLITVNRMLQHGLSSPASEVCERLRSAMTLHMPTPEVLSGIPAQNNNSVDKVRCPEVLWSQNCFRVVLKVKVRNARTEDFHISPKRICCSVQSDGTLYELDWELYDAIVPERSKLDIQPTKTVVSLKKVTQGQWKRLRKDKHKVFSLKPDLDNLYNSDSEVEVLEDDTNLGKLAEKKKIVWRDGTRHVNQVPTFESSEETSDDPALYSNSDHDEPKINTDFLMGDQ